jgi:hypothetical protein
VTKILLKSVCGDVYKKTDSSKANLGEIELVVFENGQQGSRDICAEQGSQPLSGVGDNACMFTNGVSTEIGFVKGDYYIFIGPSNSITTVACNSSQTLAVAKVVAANI